MWPLHARAIQFPLIRGCGRLSNVFPPNKTLLPIPVLDIDWFRKYSISNSSPTSHQNYYYNVLYIPIFKNDRRNLICNSVNLNNARQFSSSNYRAQLSSGKNNLLDSTVATSQLRATVDNDRSVLPDQAATEQHVADTYEQNFSNHVLPNTAPSVDATLPQLHNVDHTALLVNHQTATEAAVREATTAASAAETALSHDVFGSLEGYVTFFQNLASSAPVLQLMSYLRGLHEVTGLPWWLSIVLATVLLRTAITFPLGVYQQYVLAKVELLRGEMMPVMQKLSLDTRRLKQLNDWDERTAQYYFRRESRDAWKQLVERDNCHPGKGVVMILGQLPLWIMMSLALRNLVTGLPLRDEVALSAFRQLSVEGPVLCPNLAVPDPLYLLPVLMVLVNLAITEVNVLQQPPMVSTTMKRMTHVFRGMSLVILPLAGFMPSGVVIYWVTSSCCALTQMLVLLHPRVRSAFGVPVTPSSHPRPYSRLASIMNSRLRGLPHPEQQQQQQPPQQMQFPYSVKKSNK